MKIKPRYFFLAFLPLCCQEKSDIPRFDFEVENITIPIDERYLNTYMEWHPFLQSGMSKLIAYNPKMHSLDFFDLEKQLAVGQVMLAKDGPDAIGEVKGVFWHNRDSIFLYERGKIHISDSLGHLVNSLNLFEINNWNWGNQGEPSLNYYFKLFYCEKSKTIPIFTTYNNHFQKDQANLSLVSLLDLKQEKYTPLPIMHQPFFGAEEGQVGFITNLGFYGKLEDRLIFNYQYGEDIFGLAADNSISKSKLGGFILPLVDQNRIDEHAIANTHYLAPIPDPWRGVIYRFTWNPPGVGKEPTFLEKGVSISVFDSDLEKLGDFPLPDYLYQINNWFVSKNGLYINLAHPKNETLTENELVFHLLKPETSKSK